MGALVHGGDIYSLPEPDAVLDFSANINPLGLHPTVKKAVADSIDGCVHYPDPLCRKLISGIAQWEELPEDNIVCGNGAADIIFRLVQARRPKRALLLMPTFAEYACALQSVGCEIEMVRLFEQHNWTVQESFLDYITDETDILFLCNPNNPTGILTERGLLCRILDVCAMRGVLLVVDECFNDFLQFPEQHSLKPLLAEYDNLILLKAFTKLFAIPGLRLGYGLSANAPLLQGMRQCAQAWSVSVPAQAAGVAALGLHGYVQQTRELVANERSWLNEQLLMLGFTTYPSKANYVFVKCAEHGLRECLIKRNILIRDCANYPGLEKGYYRFAVRNRHENSELINALRAAAREGEITI